MEAVLVEDTVESAAHPGPVFMEHRFGRRFRCGTTIRVSAGDGLERPGRLANVSLSGAYVETPAPPPLFATIRIKRDGEGRERLELLGSVVRRDSRGVGIEWCETPTRPICAIFGCTKHCEVV
jgi:hypothetical protein